MSFSVFAQLTTEQKIFDFQVLASLYAKQYAPLDWKRTLLQYDHLDLRPWLEKVRLTANDLAYYELLVQYVAALKDTHSSYRMPSDFSARLGFSVDVCIGEDREGPYYVIDSITRSLLPESSYPFQTGDELVAIDGVRTDELIASFLPHVNSGNPRSARRIAASYLGSRSQSVFPRLPETIKDQAAVEVRRRATGQVESYTIPWVKSGTPFLKSGPVPMPVISAARGSARQEEVHPEYMRPLLNHRNDRDDGASDLVGYGSLTPVWQRPDYFTQRLGRSSSDVFFSGVFEWKSRRIGYLRIPDFSPLSSLSALRQLETEISYFQSATDALVVDVMRNNGGDPCYGEDVLRRLIPRDFRGMVRQLRATWSDVVWFTSALALARAQNAPADVIQILEARLNDTRKAYEANRGLTDPVGICRQGSPALTPAAVAYDKAAILLVDEFSTSAADMFAALFQDNGRGKLVGQRTNGAGGSVVSQTAGFYSESGTARVTINLHFRSQAVSPDGYPSTNYVENVGVHPDIPLDYMRIDNLAGNGRPFLERVLDIIVEETGG